MQVSVFLRKISFIILIGLCFSLHAENTSDSLLSLIKQTHQVELKADLLYELAFEKLDSKIDTSLILAQEALKLAEKTDSEVLIAKIHRLKGKIFVAKNKVPNAVEEFKKAEKILINQTGENHLLLSLYMDLGNIYIDRDNLPEALEIYNKAIELSTITEVDNSVLARINNNLGVINKYINNIDKALELYTKALELFKANNDSIEIAGTTTNIGSIYIELGNYEIAKTYYLEGLQLFKEINLREGEAHALLKLGMLELYRNNLEEALNYLNQSIDIQLKLGKVVSGLKSIFYAETIINKGIVQFRQKDFNNAIINLENGYTIAKESGDIGLMSQSANYISKYYQQINDFKNALDYQIIFKKYSDSLNSQSTVRKITQLEMKLQYESKLHANELNHQLTLQRQQKNNLYLILAASIFLLGIALLFVLLKLENNKKKKAELAHQVLEEKLEHTNKELTTYVMYLLRKNEFIISISEKLKKAKIEAKTENKARIAELIQELDNNSKMFSWEEFEVRFQEVYTSFYKNLNEKYPNLSQNEIRLCAFFKLNMSTKEIAAITYQSINSIGVARYRLRKKMNLNSDESLYSLLAEL